MGRQDADFPIWWQKTPVKMDRSGLVKTVTDWRFKHYLREVASFAKWIPIGMNTPSESDIVTYGDVLSGE